MQVQDLRDLVALLRQHPEWKEELRRLLLTEELLQLPALVRSLLQKIDRLVESSQRHEEWLKRHDEWFQRHEEWLKRLTRLQEAHEERLARVEERLTYLEERMDSLEARMDRLEAMVQENRERLQRLENMVGYLLEVEYREKIHAYLGAHGFYKTRVLPRDKQAELVDEAEAQGKLAPEERVELLLLDIVVRGWYQRKQPVYLAVEVSYTIEPKDVTRALARSLLLQRLVGEEARAVWPLVAGKDIREEAQVAARAHQVLVLVDGQLTWTFEPNFD